MTAARLVGCRGALVGMACAAAPGGPEDARQSGGDRASDGAGNGNAKKDEDDSNPAVLNDVAGRLRTLRLHKDTSNFEVMMRKEMMIMDERAQCVAALGARKKMVKTFEVVRRKMGIDDPTAPPCRRRLADLNQGHRARLWGGSIGSGGCPPRDIQRRSGFFCGRCELKGSITPPLRSRLFALCPSFTSSVTGLVISFRENVGIVLFFSYGW